MSAAWRKHFPLRAEFSGKRSLAETLRASPAKVPKKRKRVSRASILGNSQIRHHTSPDVVNNPEAGEIPSIPKGKALNTTQNSKNLGAGPCETPMIKRKKVNPRENVNVRQRKYGSPQKLKVKIPRNSPNSQRTPRNNFNVSRQSFADTNVEPVENASQHSGIEHLTQEEIDSQIPHATSSELRRIVKTEIDLRRMSLAEKSPVFGMRDSSSPDEMAMRRNQFASNESDEIVPASFEEEPLNSSSQSSGSHSTKSSDTLERGFRDSDRHMNWPAACKECTNEQKCKYHEDMDRQANISVDTSQTSDSSGCEFCKECSNGQMCYRHRNQAHFKAVLQPTPQFEISRADQVDTDTE
ncbi:hypothetical protein Ddc_16990 [Ditylenchus destructor]|nr:hypothetical protein Ddc_16990 [Ditylenchus destructor]